MMGKTHAAAGGLFAAAFVPPTARAFGVDLSPPEELIAVGIGVVAGLLPDIDHPNSMLTKGVIPGSKFLGPFGRPLAWFISIPPRVLGAGARTQLNHRGGTHSAAFMALWAILAAPIYAVFITLGAFIVALILSLFTAALPGPDVAAEDTIAWMWQNVPSAMPLIMMSVFWGYLSHLITDSMTNVPVPWPWPFSKKRYSLLPKGLRVTTDSFTERGLIRPAIYGLFAAVLFLTILLPGGKEVFFDAKQEIGKTQESATEAIGKKSQQVVLPTEEEKKLEAKKEKKAAKKKAAKKKAAKKKEKN
jgi:membrane-bound metal-dependent hydrolase YbcI (DUF457 family)